MEQRFHNNEWIHLFLATKNVPKNSQKLLKVPQEREMKFIPSVSAYILCRVIHFVPLFRRRQNKVWFQIVPQKRLV